jgi:hypothetical protein
MFFAENLSYNYSLNKVVSKTVGNEKKVRLEKIRIFFLSRVIAGRPRSEASRSPR